MTTVCRATRHSAPAIQVLLALRESSLGMVANRVAGGIIVSGVPIDEPMLAFDPPTDSPATPSKLHPGTRCACFRVRLPRGDSQTSTWRQPLGGARPARVFDRVG